MPDAPRARFPETDSAEVDAVTIFKYLLDTDVVKFDANERDKIPAVDGDLYLVDDEQQIEGKLLAQVKKLPDRNRDSPKKRFDVSTLNHHSVDSTPFLLIVVDLESEVAYWENVDSEFVAGLDIADGQQTKTLHFSEEKVVDGRDTSYIDEWRRIALNRVFLVQSQEEFREAYEKLRDRANPAVGQERDIYEPAHVFLDEFNRLVTRDLPVLNERLYGDAWKIGMAIQEFGQNSLHYGLYPIPWKRNDVQIKEVDGPVLDQLDEALASKGHLDENPILDRPESYASEEVFEKLEKLMDNRWLNHAVNSFLAREYLIDFVDRFSAPLGLEEDDTYHLDELRYGFYWYLPIWMDEALQFLENAGRYGINTERGGLDLDLMQSQILPEEREEVAERVQTRLERGDTIQGGFLLSNRRLSTRSFEEFLAFLEQQGVKEIERPYIPKDYSHLEEQGGGWIWEGYSPDDIAHNLETFFENLPSAFDDIVAANFPALSGELGLFGDTSMVVVTYEVSETYETRADAPRMDIYHLAKEDDDSLEILVSHDSESRFYDWRGQVELSDEVEVQDETYRVTRTVHGAMDFLFHELPMPNYIYRQIGRNIGDAIGVDRTIFAGRT